jgi:hypothetical protein
MTFFADLCDFHQSIFPQFQASAHRKFPELDAFGGNIFGKIAWIDIETLLTNLRDAFNGQKTDLAMPITGMGIIFKTVILDQSADAYVCFFNAFFGAYGNSNNSTIACLFKVSPFFIYLLA